MFERFLLSRVETWLVALLLLLALVGAFLYGALVKYGVEHDGAAGPLGRAAVTLAGLPVDAKNAFEQVMEGHKAALKAYEQRFGDQTGFRFAYPAGTRPDWVTAAAGETRIDLGGGHLGLLGLLQLHRNHGNHGLLERGAAVEVE